MSAKYDCIVVGAGLFGSVITQKAIEAGKHVLVMDKRPHIGGNVYTEETDGIIIHKYGAHIFHTNDRKIYDYLSKFCRFNDYIHSPVANFKGEIYSLPFNMNTFTELWGDISCDQAKAIIDLQRKEIKSAPMNLEEQAVSLVGREIYEKLIKGYTEKQWGRDCRNLPPDIIKRIPVRYNRDNNYFDAEYSGIPEGGYTNMISRMLEGADILLNTDYLKNKELYDTMADRIVFSGSIDSYYDFILGRLEYRSLRFETERINTPSFQNCAVVNYTDIDSPWTRIIEHKYFGDESLELNYTIISKEYSKESTPDDEPYYPVNDENNNSLYQCYMGLAVKEEKVVFGGRLGSYKYLDMDQVVKKALDLAQTLF